MLRPIRDIEMPDTVRQLFDHLQLLFPMSVKMRGSDGVTEAGQAYIASISIEWPVLYKGSTSTVADLTPVLSTPIFRVQTRARILGGKLTRRHHKQDWARLLIKHWLKHNDISTVTVKGIAEEFGISEQLARYHLNYLRKQTGAKLTTKGKVDNNQQRKKVTNFLWNTPHWDWSQGQIAQELDVSKSTVNWAIKWFLAWVDQKWNQGQPRTLYLDKVTEEQRQAFNSIYRSWKEKQPCD